MIAEFSDRLTGLLRVLSAMRCEGQNVEGVPIGTLYAFVISEVNSLARGPQFKDECKGCFDCCFKPQIMVPEMGGNGAPSVPRRFRLKPKGHPCWWLKWDDEFKCSIHASGEKPFTCFAYQCESRDKVVGNGSTN